MAKIARRAEVRRHFAAAWAGVKSRLKRNRISNSTKQRINRSGAIAPSLRDRGGFEGAYPGLRPPRRTCAGLTPLAPFGSREQTDGGSHQLGQSQFHSPWIGRRLIQSGVIPTLVRRCLEGYINVDRRNENRPSGAKVRGFLGAFRHGAHRALSKRG